MKKAVTVLFALVAGLILYGEDAYGALSFIIVSFLMYLKSFENRKVESWIVVFSIMMAIFNAAVPNPSWVDVAIWVFGAVAFTNWKELFN